MLRLFSARPLAALSMCVAAGASAQTMTAPAAGPVVASAAVAPLPRISSTPAYRSAFQGYQPYTDEKIAPWRESNDTVGTIGGWRAYAKEAAPGPQAPGAAQPAPAGAVDPHAGHGKP